MNKIVSLSLVIALTASASFAGGVNEATQKFRKHKGPPVTLVNHVIPLPLIIGGTVVGTVIASSLGNNGGTPDSPLN